MLEQAPRLSGLRQPGDLAPQEVAARAVEQDALVGGGSECLRRGPALLQAQVERRRPRQWRARRQS
eukprot:5334534-Pyramimonas_sp.AAC.1